MVDGIIRPGAPSNKDTYGTADDAIIVRRNNNSHLRCKKSVEGGTSGMAVDDAIIVRQKQKHLPSASRQHCCGRITTTVAPQFPITREIIHWSLLTIIIVVANDIAQRNAAQHQQP